MRIKLSIMALSLGLCVAFVGCAQRGRVIDMTNSASPVATQPSAKDGTSSFALDNDSITDFTKP
ncbi:MAG: hypothetical protein AAFX93_18610 [Verrucomicrobiota bacterium]